MVMNLKCLIKQNYSNYIAYIFVLDKDVSEEIPEEELNEIEDQNGSDNTEDQGKSENH